MKNLLILSILILLFSCGVDKSEDIQYTEPKKVTVTGKVVNPNTEINNIRVSVNRIGFEQEEFEAPLDDQGVFKVSFETYLPVDVWMIYQSNFLFIVHPGDSLNIEFDGSAEDRPEILKTIKYSGDRVVTNHQLAAFQKKYFENDLYTDRARRDSAIKHYNPDQYTLFEDTLYRDGLKLLDEFTSEYAPDDEIKQWVNLYLVENNFYNLTYYPMYHRQMLGLKYNEWDVPPSYYDYFKKFPAIQQSLVSGYSISGLSNKYLSRHVGPFVREVTASTFDKNTPQYLMDSVFLKSIVDHIPDTLLREIVMTEYFNGLLEGLNVEALDRNMSFLNENIKQPFLLQPLLKKYHEVDSILSHSKLSESAVIKDRVEFSKDFMNSIIEQNKGKVIYVDIWATWCGPCLEEFEIANEFHKTLPEVAFVYLCIDSNEKPFNNVLKRFQLEGDHYYFEKEEGKMIREELGLTGVPHYMIINRNGEIVKTGFEIRPSEKITTEILEGLL